MADALDYDRIFLRERNAADTLSFVARHDPGMPRDELLEDYREFINRIWKGLPERPVNVCDLGRYALKVAALTQLLTPDAPEIMEYLRMGARGIAAAAARYIPGGGPVRVELGRFGAIELPPVTDIAAELATPWFTIQCIEVSDDGVTEVPVEPQVPRPDVELSEIVSAYHAAFATGDAPTLQLLADVPMDLFADKPPQVTERLFGLPQARGLQLFAGGDAAGGRKFLFEAIDGCNSPELDEEFHYCAEFVVTPELALTLLHGMSDEEAVRDEGTKFMTFDQTLRDGLMTHRRFWRDVEMNPGEPQTHDPDGFIALGPLAWAATRYRRGLPVNITSDYLPRSVIEA